MTMGEVLAVTRSAGIRLEARGGLLRDEAPAGALTPELRAALIGFKPNLLVVLERLQAMRSLAVIAPRPFPYARAWAKGGPGRCCSCGDPLDHPQAYGRCVPCDIAADVFHTARGQAAHEPTRGGAHTNESSCREIRVPHRMSRSKS
jgi:hypothetical protein